MINNILTQISPNIGTTFDVLSSYGVLGIFTFVLLLSIKWLTNEYKKQNEKIIESYTQQLKLLNNEKKEIILEKDNINDNFITYLQQNQLKLLEIISENSRAFNKVADGLDSVSNSISLLTKVLNKQ